jgi:hypothetical protein
MTTLNRSPKTIVVSQASKRDIGLYTVNVTEVALCSYELHRVPATISFSDHFVVELKVGRRLYPVICAVNRRKAKTGSPVSATFRYMGLNVVVGKPAVFSVSDVYTIKRTST